MKKWNMLYYIVLLSIIIIVLILTFYYLNESIERSAYEKQETFKAMQNVNPHDQFAENELYFYKFGSLIILVFYMAPPYLVLISYLRYKGRVKKSRISIKNKHIRKIVKIIWYTVYFILYTGMILNIKNLYFVFFLVSFIFPFSLPFFLYLYMNAYYLGRDLACIIQKHYFSL